MTLTFGAAFALAQADLSVTATWDPDCDPCTAGQRLTMVNTVTNNGPDLESSAEVQMAAPVLGTTLVEDSWTTNHGEYDRVGLDSTGLTYILFAVLGAMAPSTTATLTYDVDLDLTSAPELEIRVNSPPDLAGPISPIGRAAQDAPGNSWANLPPFWEWDVTADAQVAEDGTAYGSAGCLFPWVGFVPGNIALVRRGPLSPGVACEFGAKCYNAELAGASGCIIMDHTAGQAPPGMAPGTFGSEVTIPVVSITKEMGDALEQAIRLGETVSISMHAPPSAAPGEPWVVTTEGSGFPSMWAFGNNDPDCCHHTNPDFPGCCSLDTSNNGLYTAVNVTPSGGDVAPTAGFTFTAAGLDVAFTNTTTGTAPITYEWAFGDGATSTEASPTHAYAAAGTYTVTLTATNAVGSDTATQDVTVTADVQLDQFYFVAAAAHAEGAAGSFFVTDLEVNNPGAATMSYRFLWLPRGVDNSNPTASDVFTLAPNRSVRYANVLNEVFAAEEVLGALAIVADSADAIIVSRTFNQTDDGTFGQFVDGLHSSQLIPANQRVRVVFMSEDDASQVPAVGYRSNLGLLNGTGSPLTVMVARYNSAGDMLGDMLTVDLRPWENTQLNRLLRDFAPVAGFVDVWTETAGGAFAAYGSVLDNATSDPTTVMPR